MANVKKKGWEAQPHQSMKDMLLINPDGFRLSPFNALLGTLGKFFLHEVKASHFNGGWNGHLLGELSPSLAVGGFYGKAEVLLSNLGEILVKLSVVEISKLEAGCNWLAHEVVWTSEYPLGLLLGVDEKNGILLEPLAHSNGEGAKFLLPVWGCIDDAGHLVLNFYLIAFSINFSVSTNGPVEAKSHAKNEAAKLVGLGLVNLGVFLWILAIPVSAAGRDDGDRFSSLHMLPQPSKRGFIERVFRNA